MSGTASLREKQKRQTEALQLRSEVSRTATQVPGPGHPSTLTFLSELACAHAKVWDYSTSQKHFQEVYEKRSNLLGPTHPDTLSSLSDIAWLRSYQSDLPGAVQIYRQLLEMAEPRSSRALLLMLDLADCYRRDGKLSKAEQHVDRAVSLGKLTLSLKHPLVSRAKKVLADVKLDLKKFDEAEQLSGELYEQTVLNGGQNAARALKLKQLLDCALIAQGKLLDREIFLQEDGTVRHNERSQDARSLGHLEEVADKLHSSNLSCQSEILLEKVLQAREKPGDNFSLEFASTASKLVRVKPKLEENPKAKSLQRCVLRIRKRVRGEESKDYLDSLVDLSECLCGKDDLPVRSQLQQQILEKRSTLFEANSPQVL